MDLKPQHRHVLLDLRWYQEHNPQGEFSMDLEWNHSERRAFQELRAAGLVKRVDEGFGPYWALSEDAPEALGQHVEDLMDRTAARAEAREREREEARESGQET